MTALVRSFSFDATGPEAEVTLDLVLLQSSSKNCPAKFGESNENICICFTLQYKVGQTRKPKMWKFPGGLSNERENFGELFMHEKYITYI